MGITNNSNEYMSTEYIAIHLGSPGFSLIDAVDGGICKSQAEGCQEGERDQLSTDLGASSIIVVANEVTVDS